MKVNRVAKQFNDWVESCLIELETMREIIDSDNESKYSDKLDKLDTIDEAISRMQKLIKPIYEE